MVTLNLTYSGELHCEVTHGPSGTVIATDAPKDNHGKGESFSPTDLLAAAYGSCALTVMGIAARKLGVAMDGATMQVVKHMVATPLRRVGRLEVRLNMPAGIPLEHRTALEHAAHTCPVGQSLHPEVAIDLTIQWA